MLRLQVAKWISCCGNCRVLLLVLLLLPAAARAETSEGQRILVFEKSIQLSFVPERLEWSPDNRHLAANGFFDGKLHIIDSDDERALDRIILDRIGRASIAWSPDGQVVAVNQSAPIYGIRLASVANAREIGRRQLTPGQKIDTCLSASMPMVFTDDAKGLWVTCSFAPRVGSQGVLANFPISEKYRLPDFSDEDRIALQSAISGARVTASVFSLARANTGVALSAIVGFHAPGLIRRFAYGFDLGSKAELFRPFEIVDDTQSGLSRGSSQIVTLPDKSFVLVRLAPVGTMKPGTQVDEKLDRLFEGYDTRTGQHGRVWRHGRHGSRAGGCRSDRIAARRPLDCGLVVEGYYPGRRLDRLRRAYWRSPSADQIERELPSGTFAGWTTCGKRHTSG